MLTDQQLLDRLMECEEELRQIRRERKALKKGIARDQGNQTANWPSLQVSENMPNKSGFGSTTYAQSRRIAADTTSFTCDSA